MAIYRTDIEKALDEFISNEEGMKFQGLAVIFAKEKWPDLIACERKKDLDVDAYAPALLATNGIGKVLACSITATIQKIKDDATGVKKNFDDVKVLIFATPKKVTNQTAKKWASEIQNKFGYELIVMSREDIITSLMGHPNYVSLCRTELGIAVTIEAAIEELGVRALEATSELAASWLKHPRIAGRPLVALRAVKPPQEDGQLDEILGLNDIQALLTECRRMVLEAPGGRGKTTTLIQLANLSQSSDRLSFLIDLREWAESGQDILDFIACLPEFRSHNISAGDLAKLSKVAHFSFLLNGWNEISASNSEKAEIALRKLERSFPTAGIIVATRNHHISPSLPGAMRAKLLPLTRTQRCDYLQKRLENRADELVSKLDNDPVLDDLTQTFLFLAEVATIFESGRPIPPTKMGVLGEVINLLARSEGHSSHLQRPPLKGRASEYLEGLATQMTTQGATRVSRQDACAFIRSVSQRLRDNGQIERPPEPDDILNTLCDHHILERPDYSSDAFSFEHQQFQEFYAAMPLKRELGELVQSINLDRNREFTKQYVNKPSWEEPLCMVAEEIGMRSAEAPAESDEVKEGELLIAMALSVDPIFAAKLSRLCGESVWKQVRTAVSERLRSWYEVDDENHQQCAVAGMLASGFDEFSDIILPLLTSDDQQVRLGTYREGTEFYLSCLGAKWRDVVRGWKEEARIDFIHELSFNRWMPPETVADFALADSSPKVRVAAIHMLSWIGADQNLARILEALDEESFEEAVQEMSVESIPTSLQPRSLAVYRKLLNESADAMNRIRILLRLAELGDTDIPEKLKHELNQLPPDKISDLAEPLIRPALEIVRNTELEWVSYWVANRIADGSLWSERWISFVRSIPENLKERLMERISSENLQHNRTSMIITVLAATGDSALAEAMFAKLWAVRRSIANKANEKNEVEHAIARQLKDLFRALPPNVAVAGLSKWFANEFDTIEFNAVVEVFSNVGYGDADLRGHLRDALRMSLRVYLKSGVPFALSQEDSQGGMKANLATALSRIGEPEDITDLYQLIRADIDRIRIGLAARRRGEQNALAMGCANRWDNWYVRAVALLDSQNADTVFLELLHDPEYESEAASALVRLATIQDIRDRFSYKMDYRIVWEARAGRPPCQFDEERRQRYAAAIRQQISTLVDERASSVRPTAYDYRLMELARLLADLDSRHSAGLVLQVIELAAQSNIWRCVGALEALLFGGAELPTQVTLNVLNSAWEHIRVWGLYNNQNDWLLSRCLCLLPFVDDPSIGIDRIRQVISEIGLPFYRLRDVMAALGCSRCQEALAFLRELASTDGSGLEQITEEWINAVTALGGPESNQILLSFIDPDAEGSDFKINAETHLDELLALHIANVARVESTIKQRIFQLCESQLPPGTRALLAKVIARLGTGDAILHGLNLINDAAISPIPYDTRKAMEDVFLERRPYGKAGNAYILAPRSSDEIRGKLFEMALRDNSRMRSAFNLLGQIEVWWLEYGRPSTESRHPAFDSGELWPPIKAEFLLKPT